MTSSSLITPSPSKSCSEVPVDLNFEEHHPTHYVRSVSLGLLFSVGSLAQATAGLAAPLGSQEQFQSRCSLPGTGEVPLPLGCSPLPSNLCRKVTWQGLRADWLTERGSHRNSGSGLFKPWTVLRPSVCLGAFLLHLGS